ncbi:arylsulfatase B [bacterium A37T11]|nr:arylsulfatase B [bacterium A37T11]
MIGKFNSTICVFLMAMSMVMAQNHKNNKHSPNIIIIVADDLGWNDVGFHNPEIISPNLNKLARQGVELSRFYVASICSPTRVGLLTGKYPDRFGLRDDVIRPGRVGGLPLTEKTIANVLADAGYTKRGAFGKWHLGHSDIRYHPLNRGFTEFYGHYNGAIDYFTHFRDGQLDWHRNFDVNRDSGYAVDLVAEETIRFINKASKDNKPFFAYVAFNGVHAPLEAKKEDLLKNGFDPTKGVSPRQTYMAMVTGMDHAVGDIFQAVEKAGILDNTLIWFLSDNGGTPGSGGNNSPLRGNKNTEWEGGVRSTSVVYWKGKIEGGKKNKQVFSFVDVLPTIGAMAAAKKIPKGDGENIWDALNGKLLKNRVIFLGRDAVVEGDWKLNKGQLFNLAVDTAEKENVALIHRHEFDKLNRALTAFKKWALPFSLPKQPDGWLPPENWTMPVLSR